MRGILCIACMGSFLAPFFVCGSQTPCTSVEKYVALVLRGIPTIMHQDLSPVSFDRYYMVGGSDPGVAGGSTGSSQAQAASQVFGPGVIGSDPTLGQDSSYPPWPMGGLRGPADDNSQQTGVSQVGASS